MGTKVRHDTLLKVKDYVSNEGKICGLLYSKPTKQIQHSIVIAMSFLLEEKCKFMSNFSAQTAEVELPGEFLLPKETSRRLVNMSIMRVVVVSPQMRLVEDNISSVSLLDIYKLRCTKRQFEPDNPITRFYEKLAAIQARGAQASHQVLRDIVKDVQNVMVPKTILKDWAITTFPNPTNYWTFRKMLTIQLALIGLRKYALHLTRLYPDMLYIHQDSGLLNVAYFKFNIDDTKGELDGNWPVPFRLTPNLAELVTSIGVSGPFTAGMVSTARCLSTPSFKVGALLRAIIRDEIIAWHKRQDSNDSHTPSGRIEGEALINRVNKAVTTIMSRLQTLATIDGTENKVTQLVRAVNCVDNLCRMDPAWHPWL